MNNRVSVYLCMPKTKTYYQCVWIDPATGRQRRRSTKCRRRRDAEFVAQELEDELSAGVTAETNLWPDFCEFYEQSHLANLSSNSRSEWKTVKRAVLTTLDPRELRDLTTPALTRFANTLRQRGLADTTVDKYLRTLAASLSWARSQLLIRAVPIIPKSPRSNRRGKMKSRPITSEEFERMLSAVDHVVGEPGNRDGWKFLLRGLWCGGFRLREVLDIWWDRPDKLVPYIDTRRPTLAVHAELEKGNRDRPHFPLAPEFAELLRSVPEPERTGPVFRVRLAKGETRSAGTIGKAIAKCGEAAGIIVGQRRGSGEMPPTAKYATAHDLRRAFATRWAIRVKPLVLKELMRHASVATTEAYYVAIDSEELGDLIWDAFEANPQTKTDLRCSAAEVE